MKKKVLLFSWVIATSISISILMSRHVIPFVKPEYLNKLARNLASEKPLHEVTGVHVLDPRCSCSQRVIESLIANPEPMIRQIVLFLSHPDEDQLKSLKQAGVEIRESNPEEARKEFKIETVPWFVVLSPQLDILYSGGYSGGTIKTKSDLKLKEIIEAARSGRTVASLPSYGCVTSEKLRKQLLMSP